MDPAKLAGLDKAPAPYFVKIKHTNKIYALGLTFHSRGLPVGMAAFTTEEKALAYAHKTTADKSLIAEAIDIRRHTQDKIASIAAWFQEYYFRTAKQRVDATVALNTHVIINPDLQKSKEGFYDNFDKFDFPGIATWAVATRYANNQEPTGKDEKEE